MKQLKKYLFLLVFFLFSICSTSSLTIKTVKAEEFTSEKSGVDIVFVMDYSGSMKTNDPQNIAKGMVKAFIDTVHSDAIRVGFVSYNDQILSSLSPISVKTQKQRNKLKTLIEGKTYSGNTDIGLGLSCAYDIIEQETERKRVIVLISDGETDLKGSSTGRNMQISNQDRVDTVKNCEKQGIQIYTIAFGKYDGNTKTLKMISEQTNAQMYTAETPEKLIEILYGIFTTNMDYSIQKITNSVYGAGTQDIRIKLDEPYLDEMDVLVISPQEIGTVSVLYGKKEQKAINLKNYAVAKLSDIKSNISELTVQLKTSQNQELQIYLISYRALTPVFKVEKEVYKNIPFQFEMYFKDKNGEIVADEDFYQNFSWEFFLIDTLVSIKNEKESTKKDLSKENELSDEMKKIILEANIIDGILSGEANVSHSGICYIGATLEDSMGSSTFEPIELNVQNRKPEGTLPDPKRYTILTKEKQITLNDYFSDPDGDVLTYFLENGEGNCIKAMITDDILTLKPVKDGVQTLKLLISDEENTITYEYTLEVTPLWIAYWWVIALVIAIISGFIIWKIAHKPVQVVERLEKKAKNNQFVGRLDAYFTIQPENDDMEIPPLSFQMYRIKDNKVTLGSLLKEYPNACDALGLDEIYLIADEERKMILYHASKASIMIGNSIICKQIQYSVNFGDVIYITSLDGDYDLEIHYIAIIQ